MHEQSKGIAASVEPMTGTQIKAEPSGPGQQTVVPTAEVVWWLTWRVYLTGLRGKRAGGKTLFLGVSARVFQEGLAFVLVDWVKIPITDVGGISLHRACME